jgi:hypothetical protein
MQNKIKYCSYGENRFTSMFYYKSYQSSLCEYFTEVDSPNKADVIFVSFLFDITNNFKKFYNYVKSTSAKVVLLSEEPMADFIWSDRLFKNDLGYQVSNLKNNKHIPIHCINYLNSDVFHYESIPYFLTTNLNFVKNYKQMLNSHSSKDLQSLIDLKKYSIGSIGTKRNHTYSFDFVNKHHNSYIGYFKEQIIDSIKKHSSISHLFIGKGYYESDLTKSKIENSRESADWHSQKLTFNLENIKYSFAMENSVCEYYISEKLYDSVAGLCVPIFYLHQKDSDYFKGVNLYDLNFNSINEVKELLESEIKTKKNYLEILYYNLNQLKKFTEVYDKNINDEIKQRCLRLKNNTMEILND